MHAINTLQKKLASQHNKITTLLILILLIISVTLYITFERNIQKNQAMFSHYGNSLAQHIAKQASIHIINNDNISIQAAIGQTLQQSPIEIIIVYDINNVILAQADNNASSTLKALQHFTAFISAGENIIGSVAVSIDKTLQGENFSIPYIASQIIILFLLAYLTLKRQYFTATHNELENTEKKLASLHLNDTEKQAIDYCYVICKIANWNTLFQQLNAESRNVYLNQLEKNISKVITLYNGKTILAMDDYFILAFSGSNQKHILDAFYSAKLILNLNQQASDSILVLNAILQSTTESSLHQLLADSKKVLSAEKHQHQLFIHKNISTECDLSTVTELEENKGNNLLNATKLTETCNELLNNQFLQLQDSADKE